MAGFRSLHRLLLRWTLRYELSGCGSDRDHVLPRRSSPQLFSQMAVNGQTVLTATVAGDTTDVRAYAATNPTGTALLLFNDNESTSQQVLVTLSGKSAFSSGNVTTYDKAIYDLVRFAASALRRIPQGRAPGPHQLQPAWERRPCLSS